jgi:toxin ParE1/3/4
MRLIYHPEAEAELIEAARFYEKRVPVLGAQFLDLVDASLNEIKKAPDQWKVIESDARRYLMRRFPFAILLWLFPDHIRILPFKHHSRDPDYWRVRQSD